ncbi:MAG: glycine/sarcosine/betaine reductase selenoprotein B family protein [Ktedonobacterales bacterium]
MNWLDSFLMSNPLQRAFQRWLTGTQRGRAFGVWASRSISLPQLRRMSLQTVPWSPLQRPLAEATVALVTTSGTHLASDRPFNVTGDATFRIIPRSAEPADLTISHLAYDRTDALRDINLVFPLQRLKELEAEGVIGHAAERHYGFGLCPDAESLIRSGRKVARLLKQEGVDLALLVPA